MKVVKHRKTGSISVTLSAIEAEYLGNAVREGRRRAITLADGLKTTESDTGQLNRTCLDFMYACESLDCLLYELELNNR